MSMYQAATCEVLPDITLRDPIDRVLEDLAKTPGISTIALHFLFQSVAPTDDVAEVSSHEVQSQQHPSPFLQIQPDVYELLGDQVRP